MPTNFLASFLPLVAAAAAQNPIRLDDAQQHPFRLSGRVEAFPSLPKVCEVKQSRAPCATKGQAANPQPSAWEITGRSRQAD
jgi:hypothetical protein